MESSETGSVHHHSIESNNLDAVVEDIVGAKSEEYATEVLPSQNFSDQGDQGEQQILGYFEVDNHVYLDPHGLNFNGQRIIVTQDEDGNEMFVVVDDEAIQAINQMLTPHSSNSTPESDLKEHGTVVADEASQSSEFINTEEVPQSQEEGNVYSGGIINISSGNHTSVDLTKTENGVQSKDNNTETLFISNPAVVNSDLMVTEEQAKQANLMQLACIAFNLQVDSNNDSTETNDVKDTDFTQHEIESSVIVTQSQKVEQVTNHTLVTTGSVANAVSVIHTTSSSELQSSLENQVIHNVPSNISYVQNFRSSSHKDGVPSNYVPDDKSSMALYNALKRCVTEQKEENSVSKNSKAVLDEEASVPIENIEPNGIETHVEDNVLDCSVENSDINIMEDSKKLDVSPSVIEKHSINDNIDDNQPKVYNINSELKQRKSDNLDVTTSTSEKKCELFKEPEIPNIGQKAGPKKIIVSVEADSEYEFTDNDVLNVNESSSTVSKRGSSFPSRYSLFKSKSRTLFSTKNDKHIEETSQDLTASRKVYQKIIVTKGENSSLETPDSHQDSAIDSSHDVNINENVEEPEVHTESGVLHSVEDESYSKPTLESITETKSVGDFQDATHPTSVTDTPIEETSEVLKEMSSQPQKSETSNTINSLIDSTNINLESSSSRDSKDSTERNLVKPPKHTYIRRKRHSPSTAENAHDKIQLFSVDGLNFSECDKDIQEAKRSLNIEEQNEDDLNTEQSADFSSSEVQIRVYSANKKKKTSLPKKEKYHGLRLRSSTARSKNKIESDETSDTDTKKISSENLHWGDDLLSTSFHTPSSNTQNETPSTSETSFTPFSISKQQKRRQLQSNKDFDKLLRSPSGKSKSQKLNLKRHNFVSKRESTCKYNKSDKTKGNSHLKYRKRLQRRNQTKEKLRHYSDCVKTASILYLSTEEKTKKSKTNLESKDESFSCSGCNFASCLVNNLIEHLKYCPHRNPPIDYTVEDLNNRQRIRGEDIDPRISDDLRQFINESLEEIRDMNEAECSGLSMNNDFNSEDDNDLDIKKSRFGYSEDDVIWAKVDDRFWPGLVCEIKDRKAFVKLINYPLEKKGLKISCHHVHTFDDAKWNKMLLAEAENLPHNETFVKSVQTSETFVRKKWLGLGVKGKQFFSISDDVDFETDDASSDSDINEEDSDVDNNGTDSHFKLPPSKKARYDKLEAERLKDYLIAGHLDDFVVDIYFRRQDSDRHRKFFSKNKELLAEKPWFGPLEDKYEQGILVDHFRNLFYKQVGEKYFVISYILNVWIPEAIVKAISIIKNISVKEAENLYDSESEEDELLDDREEIEKMYT